MTQNAASSRQRPEENQHQREQYTECQAAPGRAAAAAKLHRQDNTQNGGDDETHTHQQNEAQKERTGQAAACLQAVRRVDGGELMHEGRVQAQRLPETGNSEEQQEGSENAAEIQMNGAKLLHGLFRSRSASVV